MINTKRLHHSIGLLAALSLATTACAFDAPDAAANLPTDSDIGEIGQPITGPVPTLPGAYARAFDVSNSDQRAYILYLPPNYDQLRTEPYPMVALFHGGGQSAASFAGRPGMQQLKSLVDVDEKIVVFLQGTTGLTVWTPGLWDSSGVFRDDVLYTEELLDHLNANLNVDEDRVLAAGFSNGGRFVHELGNQIPDRFLAIGAIGAYYGTNLSQPVWAGAPGTMLPVFMAHGQNDSTLPMAGGPAPFGATYLPTQDGYDTWYANNGCTMPTLMIFLADAEYQKTGCRTGTFRNIQQFVTVFNIAANGGHAWPVVSDGYDASRGLLNFFDQQ